MNETSPTKPSPIDYFSRGRFDTRAKEKYQEYLPKITPAAQAQLTAWGFEESDIEALRVVVSNFDYTRCEESIKAWGPYFYLKQKVKNSTEYQLEDGRSYRRQYRVPADNPEYSLIIPHFYDMMGRGYGNCEDLTKQLGFYFDSTDFFKSRGITDINYINAVGQSSQFFGEETSRHQWLVLHRPSTANTETLMTEDLIIVDPSLQYIGTLLEDNAAKEGDKYIYALQEYLDIEKDYSGWSLSTEVSLATFEVGETGLEPVFSKQSNEYFKILGISKDRKISIGIAFGHYDNKLIPIISVGHEYISGDKFYYYDTSGQLHIMYNNEDFPVNSNQEEEIRSILQTAMKIQVKRVPRNKRMASGLNNTSTRKAVE